MRYYSEATVNGIIHDMYQGYDIPKATDYPSIEIPSEHGRVIDADQLQEVLNLTLSLVITDQLTEKEISLVHRTIGAISEAINDLDTVLEAST